MELATPIFVLTLTAAFVSGILWLRYQNQKARSRAMQELAGRLGFNFSEHDNSGLLAQLKHFDLFRRERRWLGRRGKIRNVLRSRVGNTDVYLFDYTYVISTGKSTRRITQTVFFADNKDWYLPNFKLKPETWWQKALAMFDKSDINFPENPEFSNKFWLTSEFESLIRKTFHPELQAFLAERPPATLEGDNFYLLGYKPGTVFPPDAAEQFFKHCCEVVSLLQKKEGKLKLLELAELQEEKESVPAEKVKIRNI